MSKEVEDRKSCSSNVVAKLMGLETSAPPRSRSRSSSLTCVYNREDEIWDHKACELRMDLVRQKFMEAKHLVTDDKKLHRSNEFQQVLSCNKDLFLEFLQETNSLFSDFQEAQKSVVEDSKKTGWVDAAQTTRIVVLKPCPGKALDIKSIASSPPSSFDAETRQVAKEITRQVRETFGAHFRDETFSSSSSSSSVLSNGYLGDDCSLNISNNEYPVGNSEIMSPSSRHSWDSVNRFETPFSSSSFTRASFPPESSVYREAKKRLSERWAMMSLNGDTQQPKNFPKVSTALGEMLQLSKSKVPIQSKEESIKVKQEMRRSISCIGSGLDQAESTSDSLNTLERSKSVPEIRLNGGTSREQVHRELTESRSLKSSWKISSLFFFRNKKSTKDKTDAQSQLAMDCDALQQRSTFTSEDQPSPVSVLQPDFEEECSGSAKLWTTQGKEMSLRANLIDKSPPIGSIARVLSWEDESYTLTTKPAMGIEEGEDWYGFIKTLLIAAGFSGSGSLMTRWHSPDSPLDPSLIDKFAKKELIKHRNQRSNHKLVFDCVNAIITETTSTLARTDLTKGFDMVEHVWTELKDCTVRDEVVGKMWSYRFQVEMNNLGIELEVILLQELVEEAVFDLT